MSAPTSGLPTAVVERMLLDAIEAARTNMARVSQLRAVLDTREDATLVVVQRGRCGTDAGYHAHRRRGEPACHACKSAHTLAVRARRVTS